MENNNITFIENKNNELVVSHKTIAKFTNNKEKSVLDLISRNLEELEEFGAVRFEIAPRSDGLLSGDLPKTYYLNEPQTTLLLTFMRNNDVVKTFKITLVKQFFQMRAELQSRPKFSENIQKLEERVKLLELSNQALLVFNSAFYNIGITRPEELAITSNRAVKKETEVDFIELAGKKGISTTETYFTVTNLCEYVRNSSDFSESQKHSVSTKKNDKPRAENLNNLLRDLGFQKRDENHTYRTTEKGEKFSDFVQNKSKNSEKTIFHTVWKIEVLGEIF